MATTKAGKLIFSPIGPGVPPSRKATPDGVFHRDGDRHRYSIEKQEEVTDVEASYHDLGSGKKKTVTHRATGKTVNCRAPMPARQKPKAPPRQSITAQPDCPSNYPSPSPLPNSPPQHPARYIASDLRQCSNE